MVEGQPPQTEVLQRRIGTPGKSIAQKMRMSRIDGGYEHTDPELDAGDHMAAFMEGQCSFVGHRRFQGFALITVGLWVKPQSSER